MCLGLLVFEEYEKSIKASGSIGRASVSKTGGWGFESLLACQMERTGRVMNMNKESTSKALDNLKWLLAIIVFGIAVVGNSYFVEVAFLYRVLAVLALFIVGLVLIALTSFGSNALKLMKESRTEIRKVVWPTRMETTQTFMIVFGAIIILCLFFWGLESLLTFLTRLVLG